MRPVEQYHQRVERTLWWLAILAIMGTAVIALSSIILDALEERERLAVGNYHLRSMQLSNEIQEELQRVDVLLHTDDAHSHPHSYSAPSDTVTLNSMVATIQSRVSSLNVLQAQYGEPTLGALLTALDGKLQRLQALPPDVVHEELQRQFESFGLSVAQFQKLHQIRADALISQQDDNRAQATLVTITSSVLVLIVILLLILVSRRQLAASLAQQVSTEIALESSEKRARDNEKLHAIGRLVGGVAHDFNNLLTVVNGHSQVLINRPDLPEDARAAIGDILSAGTSAADLTRRLLTFSSKHPSEKRAVNLNEFVPNAIAMLKPLVGETIDLSVSLAQEPLVVNADTTELQQILTNLIVNAKDAIGGRGTITISTEPHLSLGDNGFRAGDYCRLSVSDTGSGMNEETLQRLFEPFFTTKGVGHGTGLGLSMVHGIVDGYGGLIDVSSEEGSGTRFDIYLPRGDAPAPVPDAKRVSAVPGGDETILLIEDEMQILELTQVALENLGYRVLSAVDGEAAVALSAANPGQIRVIISDVIMPKMNGPEAVAAILPQQEGAEVIYISGYTDDAVLETGVDARGALLVRKPYSLDDLGRLIRACLDDRSAEAI